MSDGKLNADRGGARDSDGYSELVRALHAPGVIDAIVDSAKALPETNPRTSVDLLSLAAETSGVGIGKRALVDNLNDALTGEQGHGAFGACTP